MADICFNLNIEDTHTATCALRKLSKLNLIENRKQGKENFFSATRKGVKLYLRYKKIREDCLVNALDALGASNKGIGDLAMVLLSLSGLYDQTARAAASL